MRQDQLHVAQPCHADWAAMTGDDRRRHCASCDRDVHDLSAMTEAQALRLTGSSPDLCVRYAVRSDGTVLHRPTGRLPRLLAVAGALFSAAPALASTAPATPEADRGAELPEASAGASRTPEGKAQPGPTLAERAMARIQQALGLQTTVSQGQVEVVQGGLEAPPPEPPPEPEPPERRIMGKIAPVPTIELPPPPPPPTPTLPPLPGTQVIPEVEEALVGG